MNIVACCQHQVPNGCYCRWCTEGGSPVVVQALPEVERESRRAAIRAEWDRQLATLPAPRAKMRRSRKVTK